MQKTKLTGFSIVEIMVMLAIMSVLAMVALPAYEKYKIRATITEGVSTLNEYKTSLGLYWNVNGTFPKTQQDVLPGGPVDLVIGKQVTEKLPKSIDSITLQQMGSSMLVRVVFKEKLFPEISTSNRTIHLAAKIDGNRVVFECGNLSVNATKQSDLGFVDRSLLPKGCNYDGLEKWLQLSSDKSD